MEFVFFWEVFLEEMEEEFANVCIQVFVVWWVEPDDFSFSVSACRLSLLVWLEFQLVVVPRSFESFFVEWC